MVYSKYSLAGSAIGASFPAAPAAALRNRSFVRGPRSGEEFRAQLLQRDPEPRDPLRRIEVRVECRQRLELLVRQIRCVGPIMTLDIPNLGVSNSRPADSLSMLEFFSMRISTERRRQNRGHLARNLHGGPGWTGFHPVA
jgi:hypothetical protein